MGLRDDWKEDVEYAKEDSDCKVYCRVCGVRDPGGADLGCTSCNPSNDWVSK